MLKVMKFDGCLEMMEESTKTYDWTSGEVEYDLVYKDGELFGVVADDVEKEILDDIVERPYGYDFPSTLKEYASGDLRRLEELVGEELDLEKAMCCLTDLNECVIVSKVLGCTSNFTIFEGHGECELYEVYYDDSDIKFGLWVDSDNVVVAIKE